MSEAKREKDAANDARKAQTISACDFAAPCLPETHKFIENNYPIPENGATCATTAIEKGNDVTSGNAASSCQDHSTKMDATWDPSAFGITESELADARNRRKRHKWGHVCCTHIVQRVSRSMFPSWCHHLCHPMAWWCHDACECHLNRLKSHGYWIRSHPTKSSGSIATPLGWRQSRISNATRKSMIMMFENWPISWIFWESSCFTRIGYVEARILMTMFASRIRWLTWVLTFSMYFQF